MPQIVIKTFVLETTSWHVAERLGEYNSEATVPRIGEVVLVLGIKNQVKAYQVFDIEHVYATVLNEFRLYHICCYCKLTEPKDPKKYMAPKSRSPRIRVANFE